MQTLTVHERAGHENPRRVARVYAAGRDGVGDGVRAQRLGHGRGYRRLWVGGGSFLAAVCCCFCLTGDESRRRCPRGAFSSIGIPPRAARRPLVGECGAVARVRPLLCSGRIDGGAARAVATPASCLVRRVRWGRMGCDLGRKARHSVRGAVRNPLGVPGQRCVPAAPQLGRGAQARLECSAIDQHWARCNTKARISDVRLTLGCHWTACSRPHHHNQPQRWAAAPRRRRRA